MESTDFVARRNRVKAFLGRLARASRDDWALASSILLSDLGSWEAAGRRARTHVRDKGLSDLCKVRPRPSDTLVRHLFNRRQCSGEPRGQQA
jgi:hypothetical protein